MTTVFFLCGDLFFLLWLFEEIPCDAWVRVAVDAMELFLRSLPVPVVLLFGVRIF